MTWQALNQHKLISASRQSGVRIYADRASLAAGVALQPNLQTDSLSTGIALVRNGLGCAVMPALSLASLNLANIKVCAMERPGTWRDIGIIQRRGWSISTSASVFADLVREVSQQASNLPASPLCSVIPGARPAAESLGFSGQ